MEKILGVTILSLCMVMSTIGMPGYRLNVALENKAIIYEDILKVSLQEELEKIEETLEYASQIEILDLKYEENVLVIDLSKELISYGGGNAAESYIGETLLRWGFENTKAEFVSLLIEGEIDAFPEGSQYACYMRTDYETWIKPILLE